MNVKKIWLWLATCVALSLSFGTAWAQEEGLKLLISVDMEGVVGVVTADQLGPDGFE